MSAATQTDQSIAFAERLRAALKTATETLLTERNTLGYWEGELSSSALSTATAVTALALSLKHGAVSSSQISNFKSRIDSGLKWLATHQNTDGGWGDTIKSLSNISTTTLCWAAFGAAQADDVFQATIKAAERWLTERAGGIVPDQLAPAIIARYGKDRTFSVPILTMCALAGRLGSGRDAWRYVIPLPFELAALPHQFFAALRLPVVSYALPALIAIGQARHVHAPSRNPIARMIRNATRAKTLRVLETIQPENGGFLEATPLTSFVTMSLVASGVIDHLVTKRGLEFLEKSQRADGSWPIDTNLSTWCTTLAVDALPAANLKESSSTIRWLMNQQYRAEHPYTHAAPGGWAWTDLPGGVPDADDTSGALLALAKLQSCSSELNDDVRRAAEFGIRWLFKLQNRDGGIPTFCRGWGALPFDRSSADITAHAIRAWLIWQKLFEQGGARQRGMDVGIGNALIFLMNTQRCDGSWLPLWFGNERSHDDENPTYGTARVLSALRAAYSGEQKDDACDDLRLTIERATAWFCEAQNADGSWGGAKEIAGSTEETALALEALAGIEDTKAREAVRRGAE